MNPARWPLLLGNDAFVLVTSGSRGWAKHYSSEGAKFIRIGNLDHDSISLDMTDVQYVCPPAGSEGERTRLQANDVLISITAELGMVALVPPDFGDAYINQHIALARPRPGWNPRYLAWYFASEANGKGLLKGSGRGGTKAGLGLDDIRNVLIPVAPVQEQKRIADKLDTVLTRVDAVNTRLARVAPLLKRFRQSVLAAATSGRLTEDWRHEHSSDQSREYQSTEISIPYLQRLEAPTSWRLSIFDQVIDLIGGSQPPKTTFVHDAQPGYVRLIQIRDYKSDRHLTYIPRSLARRFCSVTDVMIGRYGPPIFQILRGLEGAYNVALMKAVPRDGLLTNDYLYYWLQRDDLLRFVEAGSDRTAGQDGVRKDHLVKYPVFVPTVQEQTEIVRRVETLFAFADRLEARLQTAQTAAHRLTPALLAKAFRGELVPQDPNDEPASELLKRLQNEAQLAGGTKHGRKRPA